MRLTAAEPGKAQNRYRLIFESEGSLALEGQLTHESNSGSVVVKDFAARSGWVRSWVAPRMVRREMRAYRVLAGHPALPNLLGSVDRLAFVLEYRPGEIMSASLADVLPAGFIQELDRAVRLMHERGVVHLDLRHRSNLLAGAGGHPVILDFASSLCFETGGRLARWLLPWLVKIDHSAVRKWERRFRARRRGRERGRQ